ncbi:MAG: hypothetical protein HY287_06230 [Planctomycetes bacterium]|nr:hypothetical protein [Planctomycetota bacterium]MBI3833911.1 hypothetical protein [Planctomycetota bacterium]
MLNHLAIGRATAGLLVLATVGFYSVQAEAAELSGNLANATSGMESATVSRWLAFSFTTDASAHQLSSVTLLLANTSPGTAAVDLYADGGLEPGSLIATLNSPAGYSTSPAAATFTANGMALDPNTTYWVVLRILSGTFEWAWTADNTGSGAGFDPTWGVSEDAGAAWYTYDVYPTQFSVSVDATPVPTVSNWGLSISALLVCCAGTILLRRGDHRLRPVDEVSVNMVRVQSFFVGVGGTN